MAAGSAAIGFPVTALLTKAVPLASCKGKDLGRGAHIPGFSNIYMDYESMGSGVFVYKY